MSEQRPSELQKEEKLEHCLENGLRKTTIGLLASTLPALILSRSLFDLFNNV
jgi:hypothetical protein